MSKMKEAAMNDRVVVLMEAAHLIVGARDVTYGSPLENHSRIAQLWSVVLKREVQPYEVAICMALVKVARLVESPEHRDSYVDAAGYIGIAAELSPGVW